MSKDCFVLSPDRRWRVTYAPAANGKPGYELVLTATAGEFTPRTLFSVQALEPDPNISMLDCRAVWAGDSSGLYITIEPPEEPFFARTYFVDLSGKAKQLGSPWLNGLTVLAPVPETDLLVAQDLAKPREVHLVSLDGGRRVTYTGLHNGLLFYEDATPGRILLSEWSGGTKAGPMYLASTNDDHLNEIGVGWCPRFRPEANSISFLRDSDEGLDLVEYSLDTDTSEVLTTLAGIAEAKDALWVSSDTLLVLGVQRGRFEGITFSIAFPAKK